MLYLYLLQYQLETFTEGRQTAWDYEPYTGEQPLGGRREERGERREEERGRRTEEEGRGEGRREEGESEGGKGEGGGVRKKGKDSL